MTSAWVNEKHCCSSTNDSASAPVFTGPLPMPSSSPETSPLFRRSEQIYSLLLFVISIMVGIAVKSDAHGLKYRLTPLFAPLSRICKRIWYCILLHCIGLKWGLIELFQKHRKFEIDGISKRPGHVAVITGGARGIGIHVVKQLLQCEMHVIIGCRNTSAGERAVAQLRTMGLHCGTAEVLEVDLESLASVRSFAATILGRAIPVHILINNAGIMFVPYKLTVDGLESHFQVNYLGHYLLSMLLLPRMKATAVSTHGAYKARIVNVSSCAHYGGHAHLHDLSMKEFYSPYLGYMASKFLQVLTSNAMNSQQQDNASSVLVCSVHPGIVQTELYQHVWWFNALRFFIKFLFKSPEQGADTILHAALSPELETSAGGQFFANSLQYAPKRTTYNTKLQKSVIQVSNQLAGLKVDMSTGGSKTPGVEALLGSCVNNNNH